MIWGQVHPSEVIRGHWRSITENWGHIGHNLQVTPRDVICCMYTQLLSRSISGYVNLTSEVITGHGRSQLIDRWRPKLANWGHILTTILRDIMLCIYTHMAPRDFWGYMNLTLEVIRGHWRSKTTIWDHWGQNYRHHPGMQFFACILIWMQETT